MARWQITYRAKRSPYVMGLQRREHIKITQKPNTVFVSGTHLDNRKNAEKYFKDVYYWAVIMSLKKVA